MKKKIFMIGLVLVIGFAGVSFASVRVIDFQGDVKVFPAGSVKSVACTVGMELAPGVKIVTAKEASADIAFDKKAKNTVMVKGGSEVVMLLEGADRIRLVDGEVFTMLKNLKKGETFRVKTPCASCGARGTGWDTKTDGKVTEVAVVDGRVFVRGFKKDGSLMEKVHWVDKGFERKIIRNENPGKMEKIPKDKIQRIRKTFDLPKDFIRADTVKTLETRKVTTTRTLEAKPEIKSDLKERVSTSTSLRERIENDPLGNRDVSSPSKTVRPIDIERSGITEKREFIREDVERKLPPPRKPNRKIRTPR